VEDGPRSLESLDMSRFWVDRPTFVTGATGLVGSWLVKRLVEAGADVLCLVRDWVPQAELVRSGTLDKVKVVRGDVRDQPLLERALAESEIDTVIHLAAQTIVPVAGRNPISTFDTNIAGTWTLLEACRRNSSVKQIVLASSDKAYGEQAKLPYDETTPLQGVHPYDVSKSCADLIAHSYAKVYGSPAVVTRCGNFYGGGDLNFSRIIPGTIRSVLRGARPIIRSDGQFVRDYFYVEDGAIAYMTLAEKLAENRSLAGEAFNFSNEYEITVLELVQKILGFMESRLDPDVQNQAAHEIRRQVLSAGKARRVLGWSPRFDLAEGLKRTIEWYRAYFEEAA
jgi:CDP-glucose 4,6-dehydratase